MYIQHTQINPTPPFVFVKKLWYLCISMLGMKAKAVAIPCILVKPIVSM